MDAIYFAKISLIEIQVIKSLFFASNQLQSDEPLAKNMMSAGIYKTIMQRLRNAIDCASDKEGEHEFLYTFGGSDRPIDVLNRLRAILPKEVKTSLCYPDGLCTLSVKWIVI
jgi:hypothetical protein